MLPLRCLASREGRTERTGVVPAKVGGYTNQVTSHYISSAGNSIERANFYISGPLRSTSIILPLGHAVADVLSLRLLWHGQRLSSAADCAHPPRLGHDPNEHGLGAGLLAVRLSLCGYSRRRCHRPLWAETSVADWHLLRCPLPDHPGWRHASIHPPCCGDGLWARRAVHLRRRAKAHLPLVPPERGRLCPGHLHRVPILLAA